MSTYVIANRTRPNYTGSADAVAAWNAWFERLGPNLVDRGNPVFKRKALGNCGADTVLGGYTLVNAESLEEAVGLATTCPVLVDGGGVEVGELTLLNSGTGPTADTITESTEMHKAAVVQFEITGQDSTALKRFYASLFGWDMRQTPTPGYRLTALHQAGIPGAVGTNRDGGSPRLTVYVEVDDIQEHLAYAEELGGSIVRQPLEVCSAEGRFTYAFFADPEGNVVGLSTGLDQTLAHIRRVSLDEG